MAKTSEKLEETRNKVGDHGSVLLEWEFYDRPYYQRGRLWYSVMLIIGSLLLLYALITANFLFALIVVMFALVIYVSTIFEPAKLRFTVTEDGIEMGDSFVPFREVEKFWFYYDPPVVKNLYLEFNNTFRPRMRVDLGEQNPNRVREALARFIREDLEQVDEPLSDIISRIFKL